MSSPRNTPGRVTSGAGTSANTAADRESESAGIVSEWRDAATFIEADLSGELAGQKVVPFIGQPEHAVAFDLAIRELTGSCPGTPGFLFYGDDGDSLWFWPEGEPVAFRFELEAESRLRSALVESVDRLVSQGALVFCYEEREPASGDPVFHFPELGLRAA